MARKNTAEVLINGKVYTISGYESTAYLHKVATYLNEMEEQISQTENYNLLSQDEKQLLKNMNLADLYFKAEETRGTLEQQAEQKDREIYSLKHDLIDVRMENDRLTKQMEELETQLTEARKRQERVTRAASSGRRLYKPEQRL
ncbi:MAG: cell division protein ZapA [Lachnospiraceae bacterium]|jgi:cell division protein ZapA|nr:cell division protein ZapA [Lachnospiraceae bacterium]